jgi:hypothetical protein
MADNSSSNTASVAIVILVIIAIIAAVWFFTQGGVGNGDADINADVNIEGPAAPSE